MNLIKLGGMLQVVFKTCRMKNKKSFCRFLDAAQLILQMTDSLTILSRITVELT